MKTIKVLLVAMVLVVPLLVMDGAAAKVDCGERPDHPTCPGGEEPPPATDVLGGYTCEQEGFDQSSHGSAFAGGGFSFTLGGRSDTMCVDVMTDGPARWSVTIEGSGVRSMQLIPRDSYAPGDSCGGVDLRGKSMPVLPVTQELPAYEDTRFDVIPTSLVSACGTDFGEWLDGVNEVTQTGDPHPLAFVASITGASDAEVTVTVDCFPAVCSQP